MIRNCGAEVESWVAVGTHAFDEPTNNGPMRHDPDLTEESLRRFRAFLSTALCAAKGALSLGRHGHGKDDGRGGEKGLDLHSSNSVVVTSAAIQAQRSMGR